MKIERTKLISDLVAFATSGSGVVIGQPGVGKTHALGELRLKLKEAGIIHLILPVERLGSASDPEIRNVLQRDGDFVQLLKVAVPSGSPAAVLIFDGFDAARGEAERTGIFRMILRAINELAGQWHVIVSVRTFDAKKSQRLLELFPNQKTGAGTCRQFPVPVLNPDELRQVFGQIPGLQALHTAGTPEFRALLMIPFHLWLVERVLRSNATAPEFSQVTSEVQLLELYWKYRVRHEPLAADREYLLREITRAMVERHALTIRRASVYVPTARDAWHALLSDEVLVEVPETEPGVSFSHNILFDFAVSVYLLDASPEKLASFVAEEPARPLFLRPSLVYHFTRLWHYDRAGFWLNFWSVIRQEQASLRQIIRIVLPAVIIQEARDTADLAPLAESLNFSSSAGNDAVAFTLQALRILKSRRVELWANFIRQVSMQPDRKFAWDAGVIARSFIDLPEGLSNATRSSCGETGRRLLAWAWGARKDQQFGSWYERFAGLVTVPIVAGTFETDLQESGALLQQVLDVVGEPNFPIDCIFRLVHEVKHFTRHDPELVGRIYARVFGFTEESDAKTNIGGPVMPLISNRRQDYDSCRYGLLQEFPRFLADAPWPAITAGIRAVQAHAIHDHIARSLRKDKTLENITFKFPFRDGTSLVMQDFSSIWDQSDFPDQELRLADAIFKWLKAAAQAKRSADVDAFLTLFAREARAAFLWARLLVVGADHPEALGSQLWELSIADPILESSDILRALGAFLEHASASLDAKQRTEIETTIMALPNRAEGDRHEWLERRRNRLLARIPENLLVTAAAQELRAKLKATDALSLSSSSSTSHSYSEDEMLRDQGIEPNSPRNAAMIALYRPLKQWDDGKKEPGNIDELLSTAAALQASLEKPDEADATVRTVAATHLASFASNALLQSKDPISERFKFLRQLVLAAATSTDPQPDPKADEEWTFAAWSPAPRNEAAQALAWLTHFGEDAEALAAIGKLARDPVPSVRFLVASELWRLHEKCPDTLWPLLDQLATKETNGVVLQGIARSLWHLIGLDPARSLDLVQRLLPREETDEQDDERASSHLIAMVVDYAVERDDPWAKHTLMLWRTKPVEFAASIAVSGGRLIEHIKPQHTEERIARSRALLLEHLDAAATGLRLLQKNLAALAPEMVQKKWRSLYGIIDNTVMRIYFAADIDPNLRQRQENPLDETHRELFFRSTLPLLQKVLSFGQEPETGMLLAPTAHHFMELLNGVVRYDPALVLTMAAEVVRSSRRFDYNLDSMAMQETVALVEVLLADFRAEIQNKKSLNELLGLLDTFVEAGWPDALTLVWRLDEIYR